MEYVGPLGRMPIPADTLRRAFRLMRFGIDRHEYIADWCAYQFEKAKAADSH